MVDASHKIDAVICSGSDRIAFKSAFLRADEAEIRVAPNACKEALCVLVAYLEEGRVEAARRIINEIADEETLMQCFLLAFSTRFANLYNVCAERFGNVRNPPPPSSSSSTSMSSKN